MGSNQSKLESSTCVGTSVDPLHKKARYQICGSSVCFGDVHQNFYNPLPQQQQQEQKDETNLFQKLQQATASKLEEVIGTQDGQPVPLDVVHETEPGPEEFGTLGTYQTQINHHQRHLNANEVFQASKEAASADAEAYCINNEAKNHFVRRHGNVVGVVGIAGIGKTTFAKQFLKETNEDSRNDESLKFFVSLRDFDFDREISVLQFLLKSSTFLWKYKSELDAACLEKIADSSSVLIVMDGLDEARIQTASSTCPVMSLYERAKPDVILKNLLSGNILPKAKKMLVSRPGAYQSLHPEYKPRFTVKVVGLDENSQQLLCMRICPSIQSLSTLQMRLFANPTAKALCFIPMFCKLITSYALRFDSGTDVVSIADVFTSFVLDVVKSQHFNGELDDVLKLAELAYEGMIRDKFMFDISDLKACGISAECLETFINLQVSMSHSQVRVLDGEKRYYFSHLTWQEYFSAIYIMFVAKQKAWKETVLANTNDRWEMVQRFLYGFLNAKVERKLSNIFPSILKQDLGEKRQELMSFCTNMAKEYKETAETDFKEPLTDIYSLQHMAAVAKFKHRPVDTTLPKLCHFCNEAKDEVVTATVSNALPKTILLSRRILPSDVASLCHVLEASTNPIAINVGMYSEPAFFGGKSLTMFLQTIADSPHMLRKFHICDFILSDYEVQLLSKCLPYITELTLRNCYLSSSQFRTLFTDFRKRTIPMTLLDLSENSSLKLCDWKLLCENLHLVERLTLVNCNLTAEIVECFAETITALHLPMDWLDLSENRMDKLSLAYLSICLHNIRQLHLCGCNVTGDDVEILCDAVAHLLKPMQLLSLNGNPLESRGALEISRCVGKVERLLLGQCNVPGTIMEILASAISSLDTPMVMFNVSANPLGREGIQNLSVCVHNIQELWIRKCDVTGRDLEPLTVAIATRSTPMEWLRFSAVELGQEGADNIAKCVFNIRCLSICNCAIQRNDILGFFDSVAQLSSPMDFLNISDNLLADQVSSGLSKCLHNIKYLWMHGCGFSKSGVEQVKEAANCLDQPTKIYGLDMQ